jgi:hypothetical protein
MQMQQTQTSSQDILNVMSLVRAGQKIDAIRRLRTQTGCGLKEAKDLIESLPSYPYTNEVADVIRKAKAMVARQAPALALPKLTSVFLEALPEGGFTVQKGPREMGALCPVLAAFTTLDEAVQFVTRRMS